MRHKIVGRKIVNRIKDAEIQRRKVSLYLDEALYAQFKTACDKNGVAVYEVTEELMKDFIQSLKVRRS